MLMLGQFSYANVFSLFIFFFFFVLQIAGIDKNGDTGK